MMSLSVPVSHNTPKGKPSTDKKTSAMVHRISINQNFQYSLLPTINEEKQDHLVRSAIFLKSIKENIGDQTIHKIQTCRTLMSTFLISLSEEECYSRYITDPFFRAKLECEFKYLSKKKEKKWEERQQLRVPESQTLQKGTRKRITFREYKQHEEIKLIKKRNSYQTLLCKVKSQEQLHRCSHR